jgi:8-oxo-dGTP diphosphatase
MADTEGKVHVAVGVIRNSQNHIVISRRADHLHQGGLWEFPGGKVEYGETVQQALQRELNEELGIRINTESLGPLLTISHDYGDKHVFLDVWEVTDFEGEPCSQEDQEVCAVSPEDLLQYEFPAANRPIVSALQLDRTMMITGQCESDQEFEDKLTAALEGGLRLVQFRDHSLGEEAFRTRAAHADNLCEQYNARLILNTDVEIVSTLSASGIHLTSKRLASLSRRPVDEKFIVGASCHNLQELQHAETLGLDYVTLGPVFATASHPGVTPMGKQTFSGLLDKTNLPVFALGGVTINDREELQSMGAYGIAGIGEFWR